MKQLSGNFLAELFTRNYRRTWEPERTYRILDPKEFCMALYDLRQRTGLTHDALSILCGGTLNGKNLVNLERTGKPIRPDLCNVFAVIAADYGLPKLANFFKSTAAQRIRNPVGRPREDANETVWH